MDQSNSEVFPCDLVLVSGMPDEPAHSDVDGICSSPGPTSFFKEFWPTLFGSVLPPFKMLEEQRTDDNLRIRARSGTPDVGLEWLEEKSLESSLFSIGIEITTHGLPSMKMHWKFELEYAGQLGHAAFRHVSLSVHFENENALNQFHSTWLKVFGRNPRFAASSGSATS